MENQLSTKLFDLDKFITVSNPEVNYNNKPHGGFWTSTKTNNSSGWIEWCKTEMPHWLTDFSYDYKVDKSAKVLFAYNIDNYIIANKQWLYKSLDFEAIVRDGYDGFSYNHITKYYSMFSMWDCESTVWFNPNVLTFIGKVKLT